IRTLQIMAMVHVVTTHVAEIRWTTGSSMLPTLAASGDQVLHVRWPLYNFTQRIKRTNTYGLELGDLVVATSPMNPSKTVCKRVVGLPGDTILVDPRKDAPSITVPRGHVFLCGDNLNNSTDSRHYGPVPIGLIRGKVVARV
ncbi:LexA/Signal peptidase, partial [Tilletiaria anomala UBC 951]